MTSRKPSLVESFVVYMDIYGFSATVNKLGAKVVLKKMEKIIREFRSSLSGSYFHPSPKLYHLSDSVFLLYPSSTSATENEKYANMIEVQKRCIEDTELLLNIYAKNGFIARGGIAYGKVIINNDNLVGEPIIRAVNYEHIMPTPFVLFPRIEMQDVIRCDYIRVKDGGVIWGKVITPSPIEPFIGTAKKQLSKCSLTGPYRAASAWLDALDFIYSNQFKRE